ncbi:CUGBP Elav-like family member 1 [Lucilia cuprina]|uniref:CUGBP Elav-like family member 1 n=1 Tax=Lucilia cuprina TaxID=7375 RepID=UPI001F070D90|nr:CUGBP Elav-like family member 1 [Lucilia cuprina]
MLSSLDALASKISPGSGNKSPSQQQLQQQQTTQQQLSPTSYYQQECIDNQQQQQSSHTHSLRLNGNHYNVGGLDSNGNKLCHITHNTIHPYHKQPNSPNSSHSNNNNTSSNHHHNHNHSTNLANSLLQQQTKLATYTTSSTPPTTPLSASSLSPQECLQQQQQHELFQQQLQQRQQSLQQQQMQHQRQQQSLSSAPLSPTTTSSHSYDENDSQHEFSSCLKENAFGMSDKSSTTNSLPNSPIHSNNNNTSLLNNNNTSLCNHNIPNNNNNNNNTIISNNNTNNNNNNTCSANRNVVDDDSCFRMDADTPYGEKEPDPDNIKMFVGQVPKSMDEAQLREMFEEYGPVHSINVLRDKATGISKGKCKKTGTKYLIWFTVFHMEILKVGKIFFDILRIFFNIIFKYFSLFYLQMYHPIQMKPADSENRNERKLFVGMLNKKLNENDVRKLFEVHGAIEECTVLRDQNGQSKGCAFVTFATKHAAISAIKVTLNQNKTMEGCTSPLVVKFADTQKEKEQKKIQQIQANLWNLATNINIPLGQTATTVSTPMLPNPPQQASPVLGADAITPASLQLLQQLQAVGLQQQLLQGLGAQTNTADTAAATAAAAAAGLLPPMTVQNLAALAAMTQPSLTNAATNPGSAQLTNTAALLCLLGKTASTGSDPNSLASAYMSTAGLPQFGSAALTSSPLASVALSTAAAAAAGKQIEGK